MHFTREPIVESVITPREGCKLVVRNSKGVGQEEHFVDAVEVVNFGSACFFRSQERPKPFLVPCTDYEVLEVRETRMVLRHVTAAEKSIKITSKGEDKSPKSKRETRKKDKDKEKEKEQTEGAEAPKKERRKRRRKPKEAATNQEAVESTSQENESAPSDQLPSTPPVIPPPKALISESIGRYKEMLSMKNGEAPMPVLSEEHTSAAHESAPKSTSKESDQKADVPESE